MHYVLFLPAKCLSPFIMALFSTRGSSCHFVSTRTISIGRPFLLFLRHIFSSFSRQKLLLTILLLLFMFQPYCQRDFVLLFQASFICNIIIISWEGEDINGVLEEHGCVKWFALNALFYGGRKLFRGLHAHIWLQESSFGDRGISQTNPLVFSRIHEPPR